MGQLKLSHMGQVRCVRTQDCEHLGKTLKILSIEYYVENSFDVGNRW